jgi:hypothetical protein
MRMKLIPLGGLVAALFVASPVQGLPPKTETYSERGSFLVECGGVDSLTVAPPLGARRPTPLRGPARGATIYSRNGDPIGIVVAIERARDEFGEVGLRWTVEGSDAACQEPNIGVRYRSEAYEFTIRWRLPRSELQHNCGRVRMLFTRSVVVANGYVPTCRKARSIARGWSDYQEADNGIHPMIKFSSPVTIRGYRCAAPRSEEFTVWVNCRRGRAWVYWEWGD